MMLTTTMRTTSFVLTTLFFGSSAQLQARCGDCWCAADAELGCPADETGIVESFDNDLESVFGSFVLTNDPDFLKLQSADDPSSGECYPFTDTVGPINRLPESNFPPCIVPTAAVESDSAVCAYKYDPEDDVCEGRKYEVLNYDSAEEAEADGAVVTHSGACGVCSSAQDWWVRIKEYDTLEEESVVCATSFFLGEEDTRFGELVECYSGLGFTNACATMWAFFSAANAAECAFACIPDAEGFQVLNEGPPTCGFASCLTCSQDFSQQFDEITGRTLPSSGVVERIVYPCNSFTRIEHDACVGTDQRFLGNGTSAAGTESDSEDGSEDPNETSASPGAAFFPVAVFAALALVVWG